MGKANKKKNDKPLFSCANKSKVTINGLRPSLIFSKAGQAIPISVVLNELLTKMGVEEGKGLCIITKVAKIMKIPYRGNHNKGNVLWI
ncbi:MAG: hypothetical protein G5Z42_06715 [Caldisphaeraceae archaeon]|nr:hypothetical protein [Caldisphaeraceae archaeon]MEB3691722.1 hypothetical protein [Caldisphaeraceae archaeon]MEB3798490.1 hypothetical protein [Caldisphaeraceae archaeon]